MAPAIWSGLAGKASSSKKPSVFWSKASVALPSGLRAGARGYLIKDVGRDELVQAIRVVHQGGSLLQPAIASRLVERRTSEEALGLTQRELEVVQLLSSGARNKEIAEQLFLSVRTVKFHLENIYRKLGTSRRAEAIRVARERGILSS